MANYFKFALMIAVSAAVMFALTYLSTYELPHVYFSQTRLYQVLIMGGAMAILMLLFMRAMYRNRAANTAIVALGIALMAGGTWAMRSQLGIGDVAYMRAMIPHHSIAILTSGRADITDPRVRDLADAIIETQNREIAEMKSLIAELEDR